MISNAYDLDEEFGVILEMQGCCDLCGEAVRSLDDVAEEAFTAYCRLMGEPTRKNIYLAEQYIDIFSNDYIKDYDKYL